MYPSYDASPFSTPPTPEPISPPSSPFAVPAAPTPPQSQSQQALTERVKLIRILRLWFPTSLKESTFWQRMILHLRVSEEERKQMGISHEFQWVATSRVFKDGVLDPELGEFLRKLSAAACKEPTFSIREFTQESFILDPQTPSPESKKTQALLMKAASIQIDGMRVNFCTLKSIFTYAWLSDQKRLFKEFFSLSFPRLFIDFKQFLQLMTSKLGWTEHADRLRDLFRCFNLRKPIPGEDADCYKQYLSYPELICGLSACEPKTPHGDQSGETRCRYIFRYYNDEGNGRLSAEEFKNMVKDIRESKGFSTDPADVENEANVSAKSGQTFLCDELV